MANRNSLVTNTRYTTNSTIKLQDSTEEVSENRRPLQRIVENFMIIWLNSNIKDFNENSIIQLRSIVNSISTFNDLNQCIECIVRPRPEKLFVIVSNNLGPSLLPHIHTVDQVQSVYILCDEKSSSDSRWTNNWKKVKEIFTHIKDVCDALKCDIQQYENDLTSISIVPSTNITHNVTDELDPSFMYSQILKEILLDMETDITKAKNEFVKFCREQYVGNKLELEVIDEFEQYYPYQKSIEDFQQVSSPIWWYTRDCFIYSMLNKALRTQDIEIIIKMGFFMRDMHHQIVHLRSLSTMKDPFIVYRGQGMLSVEFEKMANNYGGLLSFNSFLSTSLDRNIALFFANKTQRNPDVIAILFQMTIDPSSLCAQLGEDISYFNGGEQEILFPMHTIFRIGETEQIENNLWKIELKITKDNDDQLNTLTDQMRQDIGAGPGWDRMAALLVKMGEFDKAEDIYKTLLSLTSGGNQKMLAHLNNQFGYIANQKGDRQTAMMYYTKALEIQREYLSPNDLDLATTYTNIGSVHDSEFQHSTALSFYKKALEIKQKSLPYDSPSLGITYNNIGLAYDSLGDYPTAAFYCQKTLDIQLKSLPSNHPSLATTYNNIGKVHRSMEDYPTALSFYQKACEIFQKSLPPNHPFLATAYNNIGFVHDSMKDYSTALTFYQNTLDIQEKSLPSNHPSLGTTYNNIASVHKSMAHYTIARSFYQKALDIAQHSFSPNQQEIQDLLTAIAQMRNKL